MVIGLPSLGFATGQPRCCAREQALVGRDAVEDTPAGGGPDVLDSRGVQEVLHRGTAGASARISPFSTVTRIARTGRWAGPRRTAPDVTSNWLPWHAQVTTVPSSSPLAREQPIWVHASSKA